MGRKGRRGFTLIELLVVIVIILLLLSLLLPAIIKALCTARQGAAEHLLDQLASAAKMYETDNNAYPTGTGNGSSELAAALMRVGPKKQSYFEFQDDMRDAGGNVINPVHPNLGMPAGIIYYRNNIGGGGGSTPPVRFKYSFDIWCAGCNYGGGDENAAWEVNNWE